MSLLAAPEAALMGLLPTFALALAVGADAFAVALARGAAGGPASLGATVRAGAVFGFAEAATPVIGWLAGAAIGHAVAAVDHWIAFFLLAAVGLHMAFGAGRGEGAGQAGDQGEGERRGAPASGRRRTWLTALGTSIDALAVGASLAMAGAGIVGAAIAMGLVTFVLATLGLRLGRIAGAAFGRPAEVMGGLALLAVGAWILQSSLAAA